MSVTEPLRISLRDVNESDLPVFFGHETEAEAIRMAAFTPKDPFDRNAFDAHWARIMAAESVLIRTVLRDAQVVGHVLSYVESDKPEVSYWIGQNHWGRGVATASLRAFLDEVDTRRPMKARVAKDNAPSIRVLEKCGFEVISEERGFANGRGAEIDELVLELR
jgi:RimJ/RimL family protein N-acetyltransferase